MNSDSTGQLLLSIGVLLSSEREAKGIPVEKAAKETRMRAQRIRDMENDDLSNFTNPSYARMFIIAYAKYLGIPLHKVHELLPERGEASTEGYHYAGHAEPHLPSLRPDLASRYPSQSHFLRNLIGIALLIVLIAVGFFIYYLTVNIDRLTDEPDRATPHLLSAEEEIATAANPRAALDAPGVPAFSASVSPTPIAAPLATNLDKTIEILPSDPGALEDLASDAPATLENSMPAPASEPTAPSMPLTSPIEADRAFLLQTTE